MFYLNNVHYFSISHVIKNKKVSLNLKILKLLSEFKIKTTVVITTVLSVNIYCAILLFIFCTGGKL